MQEEFLSEFLNEMLDQGIDECFAYALIDDIRDELEID